MRISEEEVLTLLGQMVLCHMQVNERAVHVLPGGPHPHHTPPVAFVVRLHLLQRQGAVALFEVALDSVVAREVFGSVLVIVLWKDGFREIVSTNDKVPFFIA